MIMEDKIITHMRTTNHLGEVMTGAYGYLSAIVDSYIHSPATSADELRREFYALQQEVADAVSRIIATSGYSPHELIDGVRETAREFGLDDGAANEVARRAVKLIFPMTVVTEP
jgi:hypothetical protein